MENQSKDTVAERLARAHFRVDPAIRRIFRVNAPEHEADESEPIKLLEINDETTSQGIVPISFAPHAPSGICFPSVIIEIRPEEFEQIQSGSLDLPDGWELGPEFVRPEASAAGSGHRG